MDEDTIHSCFGVQQGDSLGPLGFSVTLHPLVQCIQDEVLSFNLNVWYLDDGTLVRALEDLAALLRIVEQMALSLGLTLNKGNSLLHIPPV